MAYSSWSEAYFAQACQDFQLAKVGVQEISQHGASVCMLLQMFFEKYAKAVYCRMNNNQLPPRSHRTAKAFLSVLRGSSKYSKFKKHINSTASKDANRLFSDFFDFLSKLEALQPSNANGGKVEDDSPQLEYPWRNTASTDFYSPSSHLDIIHEIEEPQSRLFTKILPIAQNLINDFPHFYETKRFP